METGIYARQIENSIVSGGTLNLIFFCSAIPNSRTSARMM